MIFEFIAPRWSVSMRKRSRPVQGPPLPSRYYPGSSYLVPGTQGWCQRDNLLRSEQHPPVRSTHSPTPPMDILPRVQKFLKIQKKPLGR